MCWSATHTTPTSEKAERGKHLNLKLLGPAESSLSYTHNNFWCSTFTVLFGGYN